MSPRRGSGFFETLIKSTFGFGKTVHYKKSFLGKPQKVVKYHDSGKKKTYTHDCGILGNVTKTKTEKNGRTIEKGRLKENLLWGATERARRSDGTKIERKYTPGIFKNHVTTRISGQCWKCEGSGSKTLPSSLCSGSGIFHLNAKPCFPCNGTGRISKHECLRCHGSGRYKSAVSEPCKKCSGRGSFTVTCNKCGGSGCYSNTKRK